ncbi:NAD(P)H dehydrogenase (quinone) [Blastococcus fimeti]|nr:NAD(P)H dehydrogenase (quinone) [Blastococcus fimeti]
MQLDRRMTSYAVTGATGHLGRLAVTHLLDRGIRAADVVAVVRDAGKAADLAERGVQVRAADYDDAAAVKAALAGVDRLLFVSGSEAGRREAQHRNVVAAAQAGGVQRIAYTSIARADSNSTPLAIEHRATEEMLRGSGIDTVLLRNSWYVENYTAQLEQYRATGAIVGAAGEGRVAAAPRADYAEAAVAALLADVPGSATYELGGPAFTMSELAAVLGDVTGTDLAYRDLSPADFRAGLVAAGLDEGTAEFVLALELATAAGELDVPSTDLERLLGRPATDLRSALTALVG